MTELIEASDGSDHQCKHVSHAGNRCPLVVEHNSYYCPKHKRKHVPPEARRENANRYKLAAHQKQLDDSASRSDVKNLRTEIATCQVLTQKILDICDCDATLMQYSHHIMTIVNATTSLVMAMNRIETDTQALLDKGVLFDLVEVIVKTASKYIYRHYATPSNTEYADTVIISFTDHLMTRVALAMGSDAKVQTKAETSDPLIRLTHWDIHLKAYYQNPKICDLRSEIALCRLILQVIINQCSTPAQIIHEYARIIGAIETIRRTCLTANFIDKNIGNLLDRTTVIMLADAFSRDLAAVIPEQFMPELVETLEHEFIKIIPEDQATFDAKSFVLDTDDASDCNDDPTQMVIECDAQ